MRFSLALLPFVTAAVALPVAQPVVPAPADLIDLPDLGSIIGSLPQIDVSEVLTELNTTLHGALPTVPPTVIAQIQGIFDTIHDGTQLTGNHAINAEFAAKAAGFNWGHGDGGHSEGNMGGGDFDIPPWLLELIGKLIDLIGQLGGEPIPGPPGGPSPPIGIPTIIPIPPTDMPFPTDLPTDGPLPPTVSTGIPTVSTALPVPTDEPIGIPTNEPPTNAPTEPASTDLPTESTEGLPSTSAPLPTVTNTFPTFPSPSETEMETETDIDTESETATETGSASSTGTALGEEESDLPDDN